MLYEDKEDDWSRETEQSNMFSLYYVTDNNNLLSFAGVHNNNGECSREVVSSISCAIL